MHHDISVKELLRNYKDLCCSVASLVRGADGPLLEEIDLAILGNRVMEAAEKSTLLLQSDESDLRLAAVEHLAADSAEVSVMPLHQLADSCCAEACKALDAYCGELAKDQSLASSDRLAYTKRCLWRSHRLLGPILDEAGVRIQPMLSA